MFDFQKHKLRIQFNVLKTLQKMAKFFLINRFENISMIYVFQFNINLY